MKLLKIKDNLGFYLDDQGNFATVDKITKEGLLRLVDLTLGEESVEFDEYNADKLKNHAHQIIYKSILEKLQELKKRRQEFIDQSERLYLQEYEKYRADPSQQNDTPPDESDSADDTLADDTGDSGIDIDKLLKDL